MYEQRLDVGYFPQLMLESVNNVALRLGLPPHSLGDFPLESDHGIIAQRLMDNVRKTLSKGWWFNTLYDYELTKESYEDGSPRWDFDFHVIRFETSRFQLEPLPRLQILKSGTTQNSGGDTVWTLNQTAIAAADPEWNPRDIKLDLVIVPDAVDTFAGQQPIPLEFMEYVEIRTANQLATVYGVPQDKREELEALQLLHRMDGHSGEDFNMVDDNPINYQTLRRRL